MSNERFTERQKDVRDSAARLAEAVAQPDLIDLRDTDLAVLRAIFRRFPWVLEVRLLGSRATGHARRASDIDLAISAPDASTGEWLELIDTIEEAPIIYEFDIVRAERIKSTRLLEKIAREGVPILPEDELVPLA